MLVVCCVFGMQVAANALASDKVLGDEKSVVQTEAIPVASDLEHASKREERKARKEAMKAEREALRSQQKAEREALKKTHKAEREAMKVKRKAEKEAAKERKKAKKLATKEKPESEPGELVVE